MPSGKGSSAERGYGGPHRRARAAWARIVAAGGATCWRCEQPIRPTEPWVMGHVDGSDKQLYRGPEHKRCSDQSGAALKQARDPDPGPPRYRW